MKAFTDSNHKEIIRDIRTFVLDFGATWCGPCKKLEPILEELSKEFEDVPFYKCDVGEEQSVASNFQIFSVPTIIFFKDGEEIQRITGLRPADSLRKEIEKLR